MSLFPLPNSSDVGFNYYITPTSVLDDNEFDVRLDQTIKSSDRLFLKYSFDRPQQSFPELGLPGCECEHSNWSVSFDRRRRLRNFRADAVRHHWLQSCVQSFVAAGGTRRRLHWYADIAPFSQGINSATAVGIPGINYSSLSGGLPVITISGLSVIGDNSTYPEDSRITTFQYDGDVIKTKGTHTMKTGVLFLRQRLKRLFVLPGSR
jgi:hypothetical protein